MVWRAWARDMAAVLSVSLRMGRRASGSSSLVKSAWRSDGGRDWSQEMSARREEVWTLGMVCVRELGMELSEVTGLDMMEAGGMVERSLSVRIIPWGY
jgi:hypothetical protein